VAGKDTGRYWEAGASNVHWVIATNDQVEVGVRQALARVQTGRVLIEGTSLLRFFQPDFAVLVGAVEPSKIKASARRALQEGWIDALYLPALEPAPALPIFTPQTFDALTARVRNAVQTV
jgi:hypothetical protein